MRRYLLGQLGEADEDKIELRLLTDPAFGEEFDTIVDEITDQYAGDEIQGEERERVEQYFLKAPERQQKVQFSQELLERASGRGDNRRQAIHAEPGFIERFLAFWKQSFALRTASALAIVVVVAVLVYIPSRRDPGPGTLASINLTISVSDRASGSETKSVKLEPGMRGLSVRLVLPDQVVQAQSYRVELVDTQGRSQNLQITQGTDKSLFVEIPANEIPRGSYIIRLYAVNPDGTESRVRGSYYFSVG